MDEPTSAFEDESQLMQETEEKSCPIGPISLEQFDTGMDEVKRMYALVVTENERLKQRIEELEGEKWEILHQAGKASEKVWNVSCLCLPAGAGKEGIIAYHVDGEKQLTVQEIEQWLANLEQARYQIAALETTLLEAGLKIEHPWEK